MAATVGHQCTRASCVLDAVHVTRPAPVLPVALGGSPAGADHLNPQPLELRQALLCVWVWQEESWELRAADRIALWCLAGGKPSLAVVNVMLASKCVLSVATVRPPL